MRKFQKGFSTIGLIAKIALAVASLLSGSLIISDESFPEVKGARDVNGKLSMVVNDSGVGGSKNSSYTPIEIRRIEIKNEEKQKQSEDKKDSGSDAPIEIRRVEQKQESQTYITSQECSPGARKCVMEALSNGVVYKCNSSGKYSLSERCSFGCDGNSCKPAVCVPYEKKCEGTTLKTCNPAGSGWNSMEYGCGEPEGTPIEIRRIEIQDEEEQVSNEIDESDSSDMPIEVKRIEIQNEEKQKQSEDKKDSGSDAPIEIRRVEQKQESQTYITSQECSPGARKCVMEALSNGVVYKCNSSGKYSLSERCSFGCDGNSCKEPEVPVEIRRVEIAEQEHKYILDKECSFGEQKCLDGLTLSYLYNCNSEGKYQVSGTCKFGCDGNSCRQYKCVPYQKGSCADEHTSTRCSSDGSSWVSIPCELANEVCDKDSGECILAKQDTVLTNVPTCSVEKACPDGWYCNGDKVPNSNYSYCTKTQTEKLSEQSENIFDEITGFFEDNLEGTIFDDEDLYKYISMSGSGIPAVCYMAGEEGDACRKGIAQGAAVGAVIGTGIVTGAGIIEALPTVATTASITASQAIQNSTILQTALSGSTLYGLGRVAYKSFTDPNYAYTSEGASAIAEMMIDPIGIIEGGNFAINTISNIVPGYNRKLNKLSTLLSTLTSWYDDLDVDTIPPFPENVKIIAQPKEWNTYLDYNDPALNLRLSEYNAQIGDPNDWAELGIDDISWIVRDVNQQYYHLPQGNAWKNGYADGIAGLSVATKSGPLELGKYFGTQPGCVGNVCYHNAIVTSALGYQYGQSNEIVSYFYHSDPTKAPSLTFGTTQGTNDLIGHAVVRYKDIYTGELRITDPTSGLDYLEEDFWNIIASSGDWFLQSGINQPPEVLFNTIK